jgi:hypothetical protein
MEIENMVHKLNESECYMGSDYMLEMIMLGRAVIFSYMCKRLVDSGDRKYGVGVSRHR